MNNAIEFKGVWKKFTKGEKFNSLRDAIPDFIRRVKAKNGTATLGESEFWAVKNVNFDIKRSEVVGMIGPNGAGKSTILKLLSKIMGPNKGEIKVHGRLSALIEVTAGFHPELTGRENVYLSGTILGMKRKEIDAKFDQIVEFSGISEFIDTPVKRYSSGMYSRLGFSVAAHMDPEILLIDEVLSIGDSAFQAKCAEKMRELMADGSTIVLISHSLSLVQTLCKRTILINHGEILKDAPTDEVLPFYENLVILQREKDLSKRMAVTANDRVRINSEILLEICEVTIKDASGHSKETFYPDDTIEIAIHYDAKKRIDKPIFWVDILRSDGILCCSCVTSEDHFFIDEIEGRGTVKLNLGKIYLASNIYLIKISILDRELIHSYAVRYQDVLKIGMDKARLTEGSIFIPQARWKKG